MKSNFLIIISFLLVLILPFVSHGQKYNDDPIYNSNPPPKDTTYMQDSIYEKKMVEYKSDSIIIKQSGTYMMNGKEIYDSDLKLRLFTFKSSASEYEKSKKNRGGLTLLIASPIVAFLGINLFILNQEIGFDNYIPALFFASVGVLAIGVPVGIIMLISKHHYFKKAIRLYNEEVLKRHK